MRLYTIGYTQTSAERFFAKLAGAGVRRIIDTRVHRDGQLAGFAKARDLAYFAKALAGADYIAESLLAPTPELLRAYRAKTLTWEQYAQAYLRLLRERAPERSIAAPTLADACLLCAEPTAAQCHRRLAAEHLQRVYAGEPLEITHL